MSIERIFVSGTSGGAQQDCARAELHAGKGIVGEHNFGRGDYPGRNVTLVEAEEIESFCWETACPNRVTRGVRLNQLVGRAGLRADVLESGTFGRGAMLETLPE